MIKREEPEDLELLSKSLVPFIDRGLRVEASVVRDKFGIPEPEADAEILGAATARAGAETDDKGDDDAKKETQRALIKLALQRTKADDEIDRLVDEITAETWEEITDPILDPVLELLHSSGSFSEFQSGLVGAMKQGDTSDLLRHLATALFKARGLGDATDEVGKR